MFIIIQYKTCIDTNSTHATPVALLLNTCKINQAAHADKQKQEDFHDVPTD